MRIIELENRCRGNRTWVPIPPSPPNCPLFSMGYGFPPTKLTTLKYRIWADVPGHLFMCLPFFMSSPSVLGSRRHSLRVLMEITAGQQTLNCQPKVRVYAPRIPEQNKVTRSCVLTLVTATNMRWIVCGWRKRQLPPKPERHGPTSPKRG